MTKYITSPMKKITTLFFFSILLQFAQAQTGLNFQGVARNNNNVILASQQISLRLSILQGSPTGTADYVETRKVTTNAQGLFNVVIGDTGSISTLGNFSTIDWKLTPKFLKIEMDISAGNNFSLIGTTQFQSVAYAQFASQVDAEKINGVLPVIKGGTGVASITALKASLALDKASVGLTNVDNTSDALKPISTATQTALDTKVSTVTFSNTLAQKADNSDLVLKAPIESPTFTGTVTGITKAMVGLANVDNIADADKPLSTATQIALDTKVSTSTFTTTIATKENSSNKSTATDLGAVGSSDILFPTQRAVKAYVDAQINSGGIADGGIITIKIADGAVTNAKIANGIDKAKVGLSNVDNTSDLSKPISTLTQAAIDTRVSTSTFSTTIATKENAENKSIATDLGAGSASDVLFPTQKAVKTYVDALINSGGGVADGSITSAKLANGAVTGSKLANEIDGFKKFLDGAGNVTISNTISTDVDVNTGTLASGGLSNWQSFTAGLSGKLSAVEFQTINPSSSGPAPIAYVEIYNGQGLSGTLLGTSANFLISGMGQNWYAFDFNASNIRIFAGSIYTARLVVNTTNQDYVYGDNAIYNGGISNISSTWDLNIKTKIKQYINDPYLTTSVATGLYGGLVSNATHTGDVTGATALTIADAAITTAKIANAAVDLTTKVTGLLPTANVADAAITTAKIANSAVDLTTKVTGVLPTTNIADEAITTVKIANAAVDLTTKVTGLLPTANVADAAITTAKIANNAVDLTTKVIGVLPTTNGGTGTITNTANSFFATPNGVAGAPSFRSIVASDIPSDISGYIQNAPNSPQSASVNINGSINAGSIQNTPIGTSVASSGSFTTLRSTDQLNVGFNGDGEGSALVEIRSTSKGFLPPRLNYYQRTQIASPVAGLTIWCTNCGASGEMQVFNGAAWTNMSGGTATGTITLSIGDSYQGGIVAYILQSGDPGYDANTQHGIIAATSDQNNGTRIRWFNGSYITTGATGTAIGTGFANTNAIIASQGATSTSYAAGIARAYTGGGYTDWYLPSTDELNKLYINRTAIGGFVADGYWSSTENGILNAKFLYFPDGYLYTPQKDFPLYVRAIRAF